MSEWISIEKRMPKPPPSQILELLHIVTDGKMVTHAYFVYFPPWMWILPHRMGPITHWMDLPEPPK